MAIRSDEGIFRALSFSAVGDGYVFDTDSGKVKATCTVNENSPESLAAYAEYEREAWDDPAGAGPDNFFDWFRDTYDDEPGEVIYTVEYSDPDAQEPEGHDPDDDPYGEYAFREDEMSVDELASLLSGMGDAAGYKMSAEDLARESIY